MLFLDHNQVPSLSCLFKAEEVREFQRVREIQPAITGSEMKGITNQWMQVTSGSWEWPPADSQQRNKTSVLQLLDNKFC